MTEQKDFTILLTTDASVEVRDLILKNIHDANVAALGPMDMLMLRLVIQGADGKPLGGMWGRTSFRWLYIELLAVPEALRGRGLGTEMLRRAEAEARRRGCIGAWLDTFSRDSRRLYERCGFKVFGEIPDYPPGNSRAFMMKRWA
jgi:ribosomal protein S18 acetylase RimI-like enzyme